MARPLAGFLRDDQLHGGDTPGPLLAFATLAGGGGAVIALAGRAGRRPRAQHPLAPRARAGPGLPAGFRQPWPCCSPSGLFEFSWRYQLPALVTLPPAGALAGLALLGALAAPRGPPRATPGAATKTLRPGPSHPGRPRHRGRRYPARARPGQAEPGDAAPAQAHPAPSSPGQANHFAWKKLPRNTVA